MLKISQKCAGVLFEKQKLLVRHETSKTILLLEPALKVSKVTKVLQLSHSKRITLKQNSFPI